MSYRCNSSPKPSLSLVVTMLHLFSSTLGTKEKGRHVDTEKRKRGFLVNNLVFTNSLESRDFTDHCGSAIRFKLTLIIRNTNARQKDYKFILRDLAAQQRNSEEKIRGVKYFVTNKGVDRTLMKGGEDKRVGIGNGDGESESGGESDGGIGGTRKFVKARVALEREVRWRNEGPILDY
ncbi:hypothetical protein L2E82_25896 [Cichorium intybus]|uniref:Uncharacterized protein n=1 Tax=Cichorium intybus TaxID=13427 RepID=A0ACB9E4X9_CICIN|nr:hypothetical protein L2E82_25896 [Cichorium intybus]